MLLYIHMFSIVRTNLLLRILSNMVVSSLRMAASHNMYEGEKENIYAFVGTERF
jgi:hypothetical protein